MVQWTALHEELTTDKQYRSASWNQEVKIQYVIQLPRVGLEDAVRVSKETEKQVVIFRNISNFVIAAATIKIILSF